MCITFIIIFVHTLSFTKKKIEGFKKVAKIVAVLVMECIPNKTEG